jgi:hypothetical protein
MEHYILQVITSRNLPRSDIALFARRGILTVVLLKIQIFCDVTACQLVIFPDVSRDRRKAFFKSRHENGGDFGTACSNKEGRKLLLLTGICQSIRCYIP